MPKVKMLASSASGKESCWLADTAFLLYPHMLKRKDSGFFLSLRAPISCGGSTLMTSSKSKYLPKVSSFNTFILKVKALTYGFWGTQTFNA